MIRAALLAFLLVAPAVAAPEETAGFLPKDDLGVTAFQREHPEADGRGVVVAVLDTGLDLLHPALKRLPDGSPKIIGYHDATDAGLVVTTAKPHVQNGAALGLSGRRLSLPANASGEIRLGLVRATEVYPGRLLRRLRRERKEARDEARRLAVDRAHGEKAPPAPRDAGDPVHDLALYRLEDGWRVVLDVDQDGDLTDETVLREYGVAQEVAVLGGRTRLGFGVEVKRDGAAVSLLFDGGGHGTHVAGIIAGYHGDGSPLNGLAPGAKLLAVKIGNGRYGGATTHLALVQGLEWAGRQGADVVNISFGGPSLYSDGREVSAKFVNDAVEKYGYAVVLSAGNSGPALGTIGSPAIARRAIAVGAWCSAATQTTNYGVVSPTAGGLFAFSSRGPLPDGDPGVDFIAPGAAVSSVPEWSLVAGRNMNGTSMAAPQASGALAVVLSAARAESLPLSADRLRTALERGARPVPGLNVLEQGYGLLDVGGAFEALRAMAEEPEPTRWVVEGGGHLDRGVVEDTPIPISVSIRPDFTDDTPAEIRTRFQRMIRLASDAPWLTVAGPVHASGNGTEVSARADPARMEAGLNDGVIRAIEIESNREVARLAVTAIRPHVVPRGGVWMRQTFALRPGEKASVFVRVPPGATQVRAELGETALEGGTRVRFQSIDRHSEERTEPEETAPLAPGRTSVHHRGVVEGTTLEVVLHRPFRGSPEPSHVSLGLCFKGLTPSADTIVIPRGRLGTHVNLRACGPVRGKFEARADWSEEPLEITWSTAADPDAPLLLGEEVVFRHDGVATFDVPADRAEVRFDLGFESPFEDYLDDATCTLEDQNGRIRHLGHFWRGPFSYKPPHRGRYRLRLRIWERGRRFFRDGTMFSPVLLRRIRTRKLAIRQDVYEGFETGGPTGGRFDLRDGERRSALLLRPGGKGAVRGSVEFVDGAWGATLFERPLRIAPPGVVEPDPGARLAVELRAALDRDDVSDDVRARLERMAAAARGANRMTPEIEAGLLRLESRRGADVADALLSRLDELIAGLKPGAHPEVLVARAEARVHAGDMDGAKADLDAARGESEDEILVRVLLAEDHADGKETLKLLDRLAKTAPARPSLEELRFVMLLGLGRHEEARRLLLTWTERFPAREAELATMAEFLEDLGNEGEAGKSED